MPRIDPVRPPRPLAIAERLEATMPLASRRSCSSVPSCGIPMLRVLAAPSPGRDENDPAVAGQAAAGFGGAEKRARRAR